MPGIIDAATDQVKEKEITTVMVVGNRFFLSWIFTFPFKKNRLSYD